MRRLSWILSAGVLPAFTFCGPCPRHCDQPCLFRDQLLALQGPSLCFAGACPRDGSVEATHLIPVPFSPCSELPVPSWARWPRATWLSELRREQGRPAFRVGREESLIPGSWALRRGVWPPDTGGRRRTGVPASQTLPGVVYLLLRC